MILIESKFDKPLTVKSKEFVREDYLNQRLSAGQIEFSRPHMDLFFGFESIAILSDVDTPEEVSWIQKSMEQSDETKGYRCFICESPDGLVNRYDCGSELQFRLTVHNDCLFEFIEECNTVIDERSEEIVVSQI